NKKQLQRFLGSVTYIGAQIPYLSRHAAPLTELTGSDEWRWHALQQEAFEKTKNALTIALTPLNYEEIEKGNTKVYLYTDASDVGTGAFLCHGSDEQNAIGKIAAVVNRKFTPAQ